MKPESVVIFGPSLGRYPESVAKGFRQNGWEAISFLYPSPPAKATEIVSWDILPRHGFTVVRKMWLDRIVQQVTKACQNAPLFILIKADELPLAQYATLLDDVRCPKVLWLMDSIHCVREGLQRASMADTVLYFEGTDRPSLAPLAVPHHQVALAADPDCYYPLDNPVRPWDVSFVGALYPNRLSTMESVLSALPNDIHLNGRFVGSYIDQLHPLETVRKIRQYPLTAKHLKHGVNWPHDRINRLDNQSKICLNIFHTQSVRSVNMRTFETCCSGSFLLSEFNESIGIYFDIGREVEVYYSPNDAAEKIVYYLKNESSARKIASSGRKRVLREHTMKVRTGEILATLKSDNLL